MDGNKILSADILDIIFDGRNKEYGAYHLRKTYNGRLGQALIATGIFCALLFSGYLLANNMASKTKSPGNVQDMFLQDLKNDEPKNEPPPTPPPKQVEQPKMETIRNTTLKIVPNDEVDADEQPPVVDDMNNAKIGLINQAGLKDVGDVLAPPVDAGEKGIIEPPRRNDDDESKIWITVQIESSYPEGDAGWRRFLGKNLRYPEAALQDGIQGVVVVQFIVDKEGTVSGVEALSGPRELHEEAIRVIRKSGKWIPGNQNGRAVKSYKRQPIVFQLMQE